MTGADHPGEAGKGDSPSAPVRGSAPATEGGEAAREPTSIATQILDVGTHAERAALLLTAPHGVLLHGGAAIFEACETVWFGVGADYVATVIAAMCATRGPDGALPDHHRARLEGMAQLLRQVTSLPDDALIAMQARHDARMGRENPDMVGTPAYDTAWAEMRGENSGTPEADRPTPPLRRSEQGRAAADIASEESNDG